MCLYILDYVAPSSANKYPVQGVISSSRVRGIKACADFPIGKKFERWLLIHSVEDTEVILNTEM
eukprot:8767740-Prorocentrum_lima.AAC.1